MKDTNHPDPTPRKAYHQWMAAGSAFAKAVIRDFEMEEPMNQVDGCCQHGELLDKYCPECRKEAEEAEKAEGLKAAIKEYTKHQMPPEERLKLIAKIIWDVDNRCIVADGPVTQTLEEMTQDEISEIWELSKDFRL
jgi:hypothetical protein